jgi:AraC-like DNA-binding protein
MLDFDRFFRTMYFIIYQIGYADLVSNFEMKRNISDEEEIYMKYTRYSKVDYSIVSSIHDIENMCIDCISKRDSMGLISLFNKFISNYIENSDFIIMNSRIKTAKVLATSLLTVMKRTAILNGLQTSIAMTVFSLYAEQIEQLSDLTVISELIVSCGIDLIIKLDDIHASRNYKHFIVECIGIIHEKIYKPIDILYLANQLGISKNYLISQFKKQVSVSLKHYINLVRIDEAKKLLKFNDLSIAEISESLHFSDQSHFTNVFRKALGTTPLKYKNNS